MTAVTAFNEGFEMVEKAGQGMPLVKALFRREMVVFVPAIGLAGLWFGLEAMTLLATTALAVAWMTRPVLATQGADDAGQDGVTGLCLRGAAVTALQHAFSSSRTSGRGTAALVLGIDQADLLETHYNSSEINEIMRRIADRIRGALRDADTIARLDGARFAVILKPTLRPDLESMIQLAARLQAATEVPLSVEKRTVHVTTHIGFCLISRSPERDGEAMLAAAETAAAEAGRNPPSAIRAYSVEVQKAARTRCTLSQEVAAALEGGCILAHFQPQLSSDTGEVSGFQAVPRWLHPERGLLLETDILPAVETEGLGQRLGEVMLYNVFSAIRDWAKSGLAVGPVSLAITPELLANPKLADRLRWELDRFEVPAERLRLVLASSVVAHLDQDVVAHNLAACTRMGLQVELAGFGHGPASVTSIRRSSAQRIRIHRSFVARVDCDAEQQRLVAAVLSMAEGLGVDTLAEGVSTIGEHAMLAQLGCGHVQGPAIARPMPFEETIGWLKRHNHKLDSTPRLGRKGDR